MKTFKEIIEKEEKQWKEAKTFKQLIGVKVRELLKNDVAKELSVMLEEFGFEAKQEGEFLIYRAPKNPFDIVFHVSFNINEKDGDVVIWTPALHQVFPLDANRPKALFNHIYKEVEKEMRRVR